MPDTKSMEQILSEMKATADELRGNMGEFKGIKSKVTELEVQLKEVTGLKDVVALIESKMKAPGAPSIPSVPAADAGKAAFFEYVCKGRDGMAPESVKSLSVGDDTKGGYLVPPDFIAKIIAKQADFSPIRSLAFVQPTSRGEVQYPRETGDISASWVGETENHDDDDVGTWGVALEDVKAMKLIARLPLSYDLLDDSPIDIENFIAQRAAKKFGISEGAAFISGTGNKQPEGLMTNADITAVAGGGASAITIDGMLAIGDGIPSYYDKNSTYIMKKGTRTAIRKLKDSNGLYYWQGALTAGMPQTFNGFPIVLCPDMADIAANAYPVMFGDFQEGYMIVDSKGMTMRRDETSKADDDMVVLRFKQRVGGQVVQPDALVKMKIATSV